jgi:hypothetical protein
MRHHMGLTSSAESAVLFAIYLVRHESKENILNFPRCFSVRVSHKNNILWHHCFITGFQYHFRKHTVSSVENIQILFKVETGKI